MGRISERVVKLPIEQLIPYAQNARTHDPDQVDLIARSIQTVGFLNPILVDRDKNILCGHGRLMAAKQLAAEDPKWKEVPCLYADDLTEDEKRAYIIADNRIAELSAWDTDLLRSELEELDSHGFDIDMTGFSMDDFIETDIDEPEGDAIDDGYDPQPPEKPKTKPGDIWILGEHRLLCGDATKRADVQKLMGEEQADMLITDPPYNVAYEGGTGMTIMNDNMPDEQFRAFLRDSFDAANVCMKEGAAFYIWHADSEGYNFRGACRDIGWKVRECLVWVKNQLVLGRQDYQWKHEPCLFGWSGRHEPCLYGWSQGTHNWYSDRKQSTVLNFDRPQRSADHPTMKPVPLFDYLIKNSSKKGQIVLDVFAGSGTTVIACEQDGRKARVMELDPKYADVIAKRYVVFRESPEGVYVIRSNGKKEAFEKVFKGEV